LLIHPQKDPPADNAPIESFYSSLKSETFYINNQLNSSDYIIIDIVEKYIKNYNNRIQQKLGYLSPVKYRELAAWNIVFLLSSHFKGSVPIMSWLFILKKHAIICSQMSL